MAPLYRDRPGDRHCERADEPPDRRPFYKIRMMLDRYSARDLKDEMYLRKHDYFLSVCRPSIIPFDRQHDLRDWAGIWRRSKRPRNLSRGGQTENSDAANPAAERIRQSSLATPSRKRYEEESLRVYRSRTMIGLIVGSVIFAGVYKMVTSITRGSTRHHSGKMDEDLSRFATIITNDCRKRERPHRKRASRYILQATCGGKIILNTASSGPGRFRLH